MTHPIGLSDIYTEVNILEKILGRRQLKIAQLLEGCNREDFDHFGLGRVTEKRVPGLKAVEQYSKLMILGKPGAGKTTFLKRVATQCNQGKFLANYVPMNNLPRLKLPILTTSRLLNLRPIGFKLKTPKKLYSLLKNFRRISG
jgi:predicted NACHT family NTPase